jgi:hypothetical protein
MWVDNDGIVVAILKMGTGRIFRCQESIRDIIIYPHMKWRWNHTMLNFCSIVAAILKMVPSRNFSMSYRNIFFSEAIALIEPKLCINHWKVLYKLSVFYVDRNSKMTTTAGHSFYIGPIGLFYNQVNDTICIIGQNRQKFKVHKKSHNIC